MDAGGKKTFRLYQRDPLLRLASSIQEWLPEGHHARFVSEVVRDLVVVVPVFGIG